MTTQAQTQVFSASDMVFRASNKKEPRRGRRRTKGEVVRNVSASPPFGKVSKPPVRLESEDRHQGGDGRFRQVGNVGGNLAANLPQRAWKIGYTESRLKATFSGTAVDLPKEAVRP
jgi:hypothetical protein